VDLGNTAICIGNFDGVHKGHRKLLNEFNNQARKYNLKPILITFRPHPILFFHPDKRYLISDYKKKIEIIRSLYPNIEINITEFDEELQKMTAKQYVHKILAPKKPKILCVGYDLQLGSDKKYARDCVKEELPECEVLEIQPVKENGDIISSSVVRDLLAVGEVGMVSEYLERDFSMFGNVGTGKKLGREIGFPTLNIDVDKNIVSPLFGVYAVEVHMLGERHQGILNIGYNPTVTESKTIKVETHVLNFNRDVYGELVEVRFKKFIRAEKKFNSLDELKDQIQLDVKEVEDYFAP